MATTSVSTVSAGPSNAATFLAPGQRYAEAGTAPWRIERQWTVVHVGQSRGITNVVYRCANGHQMTMPAQQLEAAIESGLMTPVASGRLRAC